MSMAWAQEERHMRSGMESMDELSEELDLSVTQKEQILSLKEKYRAEKREIRESHRAEVCDMRTAKFREMSEILNKEQMSKLREKMTSGHLDRIKSKRPEMYKTLLEERRAFNQQLSSNEKRVIRKARIESDRIIQEAFPCKPAREDFREIKEMLKPIHEKYAEDLNEIQKNLMTSLHKRGKGNKKTENNREKHRWDRDKKNPGKERAKGKKGHRGDKMIMMFLLMDIH